MKLSQLYNKLKQFINESFDRIIGKKCSKCNSRNTKHSYLNTRGWNHYCEQAYGDAGIRCYDCHHVTWDNTLEEHRKKKPKWCEDYGE